MDDLLELMYKALSSPIGVVAVSRTDGITSADLQAKAYRVRNSAQDPALHALQFTQSPTDASALWIIKKAPNEQT